MDELQIRHASLPKPAELEKLETPQLLELLSESLEYTAKHLTYLGYIWRVLEDREVDLSDLKKGIAIYIPMIAHNRIDAKLVVSYAGQKTLLAALSQLPIHQQKKLADSGKVTYVSPDTKEESEINLIDINANMIPQIFSDSNIRSSAEQLRLINKAEFRPKNPKPKPRLVSALKIEEDYIIVSNKRIEIQNTLSLLSEHFNIDLNKVVAEQNSEQIN